MKRRIVDVVIIIIIIGLAVSTYVNGQVIDVNTYQARKGKVTSVIKIDGEVYTKDIVDILYNKECIVTEFYVSDGEEVRIGDPLFKIDMNYDLLAVDTEEASLQLALEIEENKLVNTNNQHLNLDKQRVDLLKAEMEQLKNSYENDQILFESGVVTKEQLEKSKSLYVMKKIAYNEALSAYDDKNRSTRIDRQEILDKIQSIKKELTRLEIEKAMFLQVDVEGVYYSQYRGVVNNVMSTGTIIPKKSKMLDISLTGHVEDYKFIGFVDAKYNDLVQEGDEIDFYDGVIDEPLKGRVLKVYDVVKNGKVQIDAEFLEDRAAKVGYGKSFYSEKVIEPIAEIVMPKNCVIGSTVVDVGDVVEIFVVDGERAKKIKVTIEYVGDSYLGITTDTPEALSEIITDPSYKIKDGGKVR